MPGSGDLYVAIFINRLSRYMVKKAPGDLWARLLESNGPDGHTSRGLYKPSLHDRFGRIFTIGHKKDSHGTTANGGARKT